MDPIDFYAPDTLLRLNSYVSPSRAESLKELPATIIINAKYNPVRDEALAYGQRLKEDNVPTEYIDYETMVHGFMTFNKLAKEPEKAIDYIVDALNEKFLKK